MNSFPCWLRSNGLALLIISPSGMETTMIAEIDAPLLLIPSGITYNGLKNVVLGIDLKTSSNAVALDTVRLDVICMEDDRG